MIDVWPAQDALANVAAQYEGNGGGAYNVTKNLAKLGCGFPLAGVGLIGNDVDAEMILSDCDKHAVERSGIQQTGLAPTSYTDVMTVTATGRRTFFHQHGANALLDDKHFNLGKSKARVFYLGYLGLLNKLDLRAADGRTRASRLFEMARMLNMATAGDLVSNETGDFSAIVNPSLPYLDFLFLNEYELARLVGCDASQRSAEVVSQAREVLERGVRGAVIAHWPEGAVCVCRDEVILQPAVRMPANQIAGTAGAGDAFSAGFLLGVHEGRNYQRCMELAVCAAAASLRDPTCSAAIEPWQKCLALGAEMGFHSEI